MKSLSRSLWLSAMNRAGGWWMGQAASTIRQAQGAALKAALRPKAPAKPRKPRRKA